MEEGGRGLERVAQGRWRGGALVIDAIDKGSGSSKTNERRGSVNAAVHYTYCVSWSVEDEEFKGTALELPSLSWMEPDAEAAFAGIRRLARDVVADLERAGERVPAPLADRTYSGNFAVQIPPATHRRLAERAAEERVSLSQHVADRLASA